MDIQKGNEHGGRFWISGVVDSYNRKGEIIYIGKTPISLKDVPKEQKGLLSVGDSVICYFDGKNNYYATSMKNNSLRHEFDKGKKSTPSEVRTITKKSPEDFQTLIKELEPFFGQVFEKMSDSDRRELKETMISSLDQAIKLLDITATFEETKKDIADLAESVLEVAAVITVVIDGNTTQILKNNLPKEEKK
jgi:hypothetical protein